MFLQSAIIPIITMPSHHSPQVHLLAGYGYPVRVQKKINPHRETFTMAAAQA